MKTWWLSYADDGFLGVVIAEADTFSEACFEARLRDCSPGGQVHGEDISNASDPASGATAEFVDWLAHAPRSTTPIAADAGRRQNQPGNS